MVSLAYFKIGGLVWKAKYKNRWINLFSCPINREFTKEDYHRAIKTIE